MTALHDTIRTRIDAAWADFLGSWSDLDDADLTTSGVTGDWSVKDILAHVTTWEESTMSLSQVQIEGREPPKWNADGPWDLDTFNARASAEKADFSLDEVRTQLAETHDR
ncbi:MAG TPA: DinB family protein, partial [Thermomicrobiales bacterium]|nr:DinB family protein [Thermomicrobiales bacterium]